MYKRLRYRKLIIFIRFTQDKCQVRNKINLNDSRPGYLNTASGTEESRIILKQIEG
jgi:hypothetical protein